MKKVLFKVFYKLKMYKIARSISPSLYCNARAKVALKGLDDSLQTFCKNGKKICDDFARMNVNVK